jgi:signal peptidase I
VPARREPFATAATSAVAAAGAVGATGATALLKPSAPDVEGPDVELPEEFAAEEQPNRPGWRRIRGGFRSADGAGEKPKRGRRRKTSFWRELPVLIVVALLLTFLIQTFVARVYQIPSGSMETTLHGCSGCTNDRVLVDKLSYRFGDPSPGDVVVFLGPPGWQHDDEDPVERSDNAIVRGLQDGLSLIGLAPPDEEDFIKRVIAVGGQTVSCCDNQNRVLVDGKPLNEPYIYYVPDVFPKKQTAFGPVKIPEGELWMMGDSRNNSADSRVAGQGPVPVSYVIGKARFVVLPLHRIKAIPEPNPQEVSLSAGSGPPSVLWGLVGAVPVTLGSRRLRLRRRRHRPAPAGKRVG